MSLDNVLAILAMAAVTYATRIAGVALGERIPRHGPLGRALDAVPAAVLTAVIAPALLAGRAEMIAGAATALAMTRLPMLAAIAIGMTVAAVLRAWT
jgi:uncharacterized membrane protein